MSRRLDDLSTALRPLADALLAALAADQVTVRVISTLRTMAEHQANLRRGTSSAILSFHLPRHLRVPGLSPADPDFDKADALDLVLYDPAVNKALWDTELPGWQAIGHHAERLGLEWGGRWKKPYDPGHVQLPRAVWQRRP